MLIALPAAHPLAERELVHWTDLRCEGCCFPPLIRDRISAICCWDGFLPLVLNRISECINRAAKQF